MRIIGMMALNNHPKWMYCLVELLKLCEGVVLRWDGRTGDPQILKEIEGLCGEKLLGCFIAPVEMAWTVPQWREDTLTILNEHNPDIVLTPDEDEVFGDGLMDELKAFWYSEKKGMMFMYDPLVTSDGRIVNDGKPYPPESHMKAFKWEKGLSYFPYHGSAMPARYANSRHHWKAKTKIKHYAAYTKAMEAGKTWRSDIPGKRGRKAVTLIGFGPSASQNMDVVGEIWSLNNAYEALQESTKPHLTRIFEMHNLDKRKNERARDGQFHLQHLSSFGSNGVRIILQEENKSICNSESYPLYDVIKQLGLDWFAGTPCYMVAMAILEGYTEIRVFGLDQMDWEHTLQRECFAAWMCYAVGRGIKISGCLTFLSKYTKRYGYDYGPEWDEYQNDILWSGHPMEIKYKIPSRAVKGKLFDGKK